MDSNTTYLVTNRSASVVVYSIPEDNIIIAKDGFIFVF